MKELLISKRFIEYLQKYYVPLRTFDFFGYIVPVDEKQKYLCAVWMNGEFMFMPAEPKYRLSKWKAKGFIKKLIKVGMLEEDIVVFEDVDERKHVPYEEDKVVKVPVHIFNKRED